MFLIFEMIFFLKINVLFIIYFILYNFFLIFKVRVYLWDFFGSLEYIDVRNELYINIDVIFFVFDVINLLIFENMENWLKEV